jgi:hypothetical protein
MGVRYEYAYTKALLSDLHPGLVPFYQSWSIVVIVKMTQHTDMREVFQDSHIPSSLPCSSL